MTDANDAASYVDFGALTPLEYLSLGDRERIHTETLSWLLSKDSALAHGTRLDFLSGLVGLELRDSVIKSVTSEDHHIDLMITVVRGEEALTIAVENKLKSAEHSSQLSRYDVHLQRFEHCAKLFLTLIEQPPNSSTSWKPVSYSTLLSALRTSVSNGEIVTSEAFVRDYIATLARLVEAARRVVSLPDLYAGNGAVFSDVVDAEAPPDFDRFASYTQRMHLRTILQKAWMLALGQAVAKQHTGAFRGWDVSETRARAHLQFDVCVTECDGAKFRIGVQLQNRAFKIFCAPYDYQWGASAEAHASVEKILKAIKAEAGLEASRLSTTGDRGFRSFSAIDLAPRNTLELATWNRAYGRALTAVYEAVNSLGLVG